MAQSQTGRGSDGLNLDSASSGSSLESLLNHLNAIIQHPASKRVQAIARSSKSIHLRFACDVGKQLKTAQPMAPLLPLHQLRLLTRYAARWLAGDSCREPGTHLTSVQAILEHELSGLLPLTRRRQRSGKKPVPCQTTLHQPVHRMIGWLACYTTAPDQLAMLQASNGRP